MTLLQIFNATLESLPKFSDSLQMGILQMDFWSKTKTDQALSIVKQLKRSDVIDTKHFTPYCSISFRPITITLSPRDCNIESDTFGPENIEKADNFIKDILHDLNIMSLNSIRFRYGGHDYDNNKCEFTINWEF